MLDTRVYPQRIGLQITSRLQAETEPYDVEVPLIDVEDGLDTDGKMWEHVRDPAKVGVQEGRVFLSSRGRAHLRKLIDEEKARRFEAKILWLMKFWLPLLASLVGIIGALTGLVAVLQHKK